MTFSKTILVGFSMLAFAGAAAQAAETKPGSSMERKGDAAMQRAPLGAGEARASELLGMDVTNPQGEDLGEIKDIVVDLQAGKVHAAVLEFGGILGVGEKHFAFPISQLKTGKDRDKLVLNVDKEKLKDAEGFAKGQWPAMNDEYWGRMAGMGTGQAQRPAGAGATKGSAAKMHLVRASELMGKNVHDKSGKEVGEVQDVIVSLGNGQIRNVVLDLDGGGEAHVQAKAFSAGTDGKLMTSMNRDQLKAQTKSRERNPVPGR